MKKFLAVILTFVYVFSAVPAFSSCRGCEDNCEEVKQIRTEDHQRTTTASFKLDPLMPVMAARGILVRVDGDVRTGAGQPLSLFSNKIPLFVRHCNFRI